MAMQRVLAKFGIAEIVRTGKISLKRGDHLLEMGGWGDGVERRSKLEKLQRHLQEQQAQQAAAAEQQSHASRRGGMLAALQVVIITVHESFKIHPQDLHHCALQLA